MVTGNITRGAQDKIYEKYKSSNIKFIAGDRISRLIEEHLPNLVEDISLELGDYLSRSRVQSEEMDRNDSLVPIVARGFYIEPDIYPIENPGYNGKKRNEKTVDILEVIGTNRIVLLQGNMGAGKSKLIRKLMEHFCNAESYKKTRFIPIFTTFSDYIDKFDMSIAKVIEGFLNEEARKEAKDDSFLILMDGIDEKDMPTDQRISALKELAKNINELPKAHLLATSRYLDGLDEMKDMSDFKRYELRPLSLGKMLEFLKFLCSSLNMSSRIIEDLKKSQLFKELPKSPIAAILLANLINERSKDLPSNMTELYTKYLELMLGRWDIEKGLQSQKEYETLEMIMMEISTFTIENGLGSVALSEVRDMVERYLKDRNLGVSVDTVFGKMFERCQILSVDQSRGVVSFKHRTFPEFFYAKKLLSSKSLKMDEKAFNFYWMSIYFFYIGLQRDCPENLRALISLVPASEPEKWIKILNFSNYFLAGYATPYEVIETGLFNVLIEAAGLCKAISAEGSSSPFASFPKMHILYILQYLLRDSYSYEFFNKAIANVALQIDSCGEPDDIKAQSLFFLAVINLSLGGPETLDFLIEKYSGKMPLDVSLAVRHTSAGAKVKTKIMKKHERHMKHLLRGNQALSAKISDLYKKPTSRLKKL